MAHAEGTITITAPIETVFNYLVDGKNNLEWRPGVQDIELTSSSRSARSIGATYKQGIKGPGGKRIDGSYKITVLEPYTEIGFQVIAGPARPEGYFYLAHEGTTTTVRFVLNRTPHGLKDRPMEPLVKIAMKQEVGTLPNLKACLEKANKATKRR